MTAQTTPRPVLVGIDGSPAALEALALGTALCVLSGSSLVLVAVYGYEARGVDVPSVPWPSRQAAAAWLEQAEEQFGDAIPSRSVSISATTAARGLIEAAELEDAAVIVLGSCHRGPIGRVLAGSTARRVVHGAPCAIAVVPHAWRLRPDSEPVTIGAAITDSPESREALTVAARLAEPAHARLKVLHVVHLLPAAHPYFGATGTSYLEWVKGEHRYGERIAREVVDAVLPDQDVDLEILSGDSVQTLAEASAALDVLVLGSRRYGPVRSTIMGSVSLPMIEQARCAILIVPRGVHSMFAATEQERASSHA